MAHSFTSLHYHLVFSTKERRPWLADPVRQELWAFMGGIIRDFGGVTLAVNGIPDHVHLLVGLHPDRTLSDTLRALKAGSSRYLHQAGVDWLAFSWQTGYSAFTVSYSQIEIVRRYIENQEEHHRKTTFEDELRRLVQLHGLEISEDASLE
jgi:putative transposase